MRVHLAAPVPHRDITNDWEPDAYVGKTLRLCRMLTGLGHHVVLYSGPGNDAPVAEHVTVVTADDRRRWFGDVDWAETVFNEFDPGHPAWTTSNLQTIDAMADRLEPGDIIGLTMGTAQAAIRGAFPDHVVAEVGVGYEGVVDGTHRCYESYAWMHHVWGRTGVSDGRWFDVVIPNAYDPADYEPRLEKDDYLLFMGRHTERKGLEVVRELAKHHRVVTAGQGPPISGTEHVGMVRGAEKAALLAGARALLAPTTYVEPFGGVVVEAMLSGTPVITTDWGAFTETVDHGVTGYRCRTLGEFLDAAKLVDGLFPAHIHKRATGRFTLAAVAPAYDRWLGRLGTLYSSGWYA